MTAQQRVGDADAGSFADAIVATDPPNDLGLVPPVAMLSDGRVPVVGSQCWNPGCYGLDAIPDAADRAISAEIFD
jgi:hypothetical protein